MKYRFSLSHSAAPSAALLFILFFLAFSVPVFSQTASIHETTKVFPTYPYSDPNPVARMGKIYPYYRFDGYTNIPVDKEWKIVEMENEWVKIYVAPDMGGKILGGIEKSTGREFIYFNKVIKFRDISMRGAWTSGGIEINFGSIGHAPTTASPVDYRIKKNDDGSVSCWVGAMDLTSRTVWRVEIRLPANRAWVETHAFWYNPTDLTTSKYHWMTSSEDVDDDLVYYFPGQNEIGHGSEHGPWPLLPDGRNLSNYPENNYGSDHSYHVLGTYTDFWGGYYANRNFGFGHLNDYAEKPGKKIWIWALSRQGAIWKDLLTDADNLQYTELQTGLLFNQAALGSTYSPFKHLGFNSMNTERFTEYWFPILGTGGITEAKKEGVLGIDDKSKIENRLRFMALQPLNSILTVKLENGEDREFPLALKPMQLFEQDFDSGIAEVELGKRLFWSAEDQEARKTDRPVVSPEFDWKSIQGLYMKAVELARQREYPNAIQAYQDCLSKDPNYIPALTGLSEEYIRLLKFDQAEELLKRALSINTYEPAANYLYGILKKKTGRGNSDFYDAREAFGICIRSMEYRSAAYTQLSEISIIEKEYADALRYARAAQDYNRFNIAALQYEITTLRLSGQTTEAKERVIALLDLDPLNHYGWFEKYKLNMPMEKGQSKTHLLPFNRGEFPGQTYLELAIRYASLDLGEEAIEILESAPKDPLINYWLAYLHKKNSFNTYLSEAVSAPTKFVLPYRAETLQVLLWAESESPAWQTRYYMGLMQWNLGNLNEAMELFRSCKDEPEEAYFYLTRAKLFDSRDLDLVMHDLQRALDLDPKEWRVYQQFANYFFAHQGYVQAKKILQDGKRAVPDHFVLQFLESKAELYNHNYSACLKILGEVNILPNEGARAGHNLYRQAHLMSALESLRKNRIKEALEDVAQARLWPENLGVGRPYQTDERIENYLEGIAQLQGKDDISAMDAFARLVQYAENKRGTWDSPVLLTALALRLTDREERADQLMADWIKARPNDLLANWARAIYNKNEEAARFALSRIAEFKNDTPWNPGKADAQFPLVYEVVRQIKIE